MGSFARAITAPFRKARTLLNPDGKEKRPQQEAASYDLYDTRLQGEVMACAYEDVKVMWSMMLDKSRPLTVDSSDCSCIVNV